MILCEWHSLIFVVDNYINPTRDGGGWGSWLREKQIKYCMYVLCIRMFVCSYVRGLVCLDSDLLRFEEAAPTRSHIARKIIIYAYEIG